MFRKLRADEIEVRVGSVMNGAATLLLYKDARCDMNILDETVGAMDWKKSYQLIDGQLFCTVEIWDDEKKEWVSKQDVGVESYTEAEKGRASDAQKRAAVAWGIGRELYTAPRIKIKCETEMQGGGYRLKNKWEFWGVSVSDIDYDENGNICRLALAKDGRTIYEFSNGVPDVVEKASQEAEEKITDAQRKTLLAMMDANGVSVDTIIHHYNVGTISDLTQMQYGSALNKLKATEKSKKEIGVEK